MDSSKQSAALSSSSTNININHSNNNNNNNNNSTCDKQQQHNLHAQQPQQQHPPFPSSVSSKSTITTTSASAMPPSSSSFSSAATAAATAAQQPVNKSNDSTLSGTSANVNESNNGNSNSSSSSNNNRKATTSSDYRKVFYNNLLQKKNGNNVSNYDNMNANAGYSAKNGSYNLKNSGEFSAGNADNFDHDYNGLYAPSSSMSFGNFDANAYPNDKNTNATTASTAADEKRNSQNAFNNDNFDYGAIKNPEFFNSASMPSVSVPSKPGYDAFASYDGNYENRGENYNYNYYDNNNNSNNYNYNDNSGNFDNYNSFSGLEYETAAAAANAGSAAATYGQENNDIGAAPVSASWSYNGNGTKNDIYQEELGHLTDAFGRSLSLSSALPSNLPQQQQQQQQQQQPSPLSSQIPMSLLTQNYQKTTVAPHHSQIPSSSGAGVGPPASTGQLGANFNVNPNYSSFFTELTSSRSPSIGSNFYLTNNLNGLNNSQPQHSPQQSPTNPMSMSSMAMTSANAAANAKRPATSSAAFGNTTDGDNNVNNGIVTRRASVAPLKSNRTSIYNNNGNNNKFPSLGSSGRSSTFENTSAAPFMPLSSTTSYSYSSDLNPAYPSKDLNDFYGSGGPGANGRNSNAFVLPHELQGGISSINSRRPSYAAEIFYRDVSAGGSAFSTGASNDVNGRPTDAYGLNMNNELDLNDNDFGGDALGESIALQVASSSIDQSRNQNQGDNRGQQQQVLQNQKLLFGDNNVEAQDDMFNNIDNNNINRAMLTDFNEPSLAQPNSLGGATGNFGISNSTNSSPVTNRFQYGGRSASISNAIMAFDNSDANNSNNAPRSAMAVSFNLPPESPFKKPYSFGKFSTEQQQQQQPLHNHHQRQSQQQSQQQQQQQFQGHQASNSSVGLENGLLLVNNHIITSPELRALYHQTSNYFCIQTAEKVYNRIKALLDPMAAHAPKITNLVSFLKRKNDIGGGSSIGGSSNNAGGFGHSGGGGGNNSKFKSLCLVCSKAGKIDVLTVPPNSNILLQRHDLVIVEGDRGKDLVHIIEPTVGLNFVVLLNFLKKREHLKSMGGVVPIGGTNDPSNSSAKGKNNGHQSNGATSHVHSTANYIQDDEHVISLPSKQILRFASAQEVSQLNIKFKSEIIAFKIALEKLNQINMKVMSSSNRKYSTTSSSSQSNNNNNGASTANESNKGPLNMKIFNSEYQFDKKKLIFYYSCDKRNDFRDLIKELFKVYKTRIWLCAVLNPDEFNPYSPSNIASRKNLESAISEFNASSYTGSYFSAAVNAASIGNNGNNNNNNPKLSINVLPGEQQEHHHQSASFLNQPVTSIGTVNNNSMVSATGDSIFGYPGIGTAAATAGGRVDRNNSSGSSGSGNYQDDSKSVTTMSSVTNASTLGGSLSSAPSTADSAITGWPNLPNSSTSIGSLGSTKTPTLIESDPNVATLTSSPVSSSAALHPPQAFQWQAKNNAGNFSLTSSPSPKASASQSSASASGSGSNGASPTSISTLSSDANNNSQQALLKNEGNNLHHHYSNAFGVPAVAPLSLSMVPESQSQAQQQNQIQNQNQLNKIFNQKRDQMLKHKYQERINKILLLDENNLEFEGVQVDDFHASNLLNSIENLKIDLNIN